jgi:hypothetical protein
MTWGRILSLIDSVISNNARFLRSSLLVGVVLTVAPDDAPTSVTLSFPVTLLAAVTVESTVSNEEELDDPKFPNSKFLTARRLTCHHSFSRMRMVCNLKDHNAYLEAPSSLLLSETSL